MTLKINQDNWDTVRLDLQKKPWAIFRMNDLATEVAYAGNVPAATTKLSDFLKLDYKSLVDRSELKKGENMNSFFHIIELFDKQDGDWADLTGFSDFDDIDLNPSSADDKEGGAENDSEIEAGEPDYTDVEFLPPIDDPIIKTDPNELSQPDNTSLDHSDITNGAVINENSEKAEKQIDEPETIAVADELDIEASLAEPIAIDANEQNEVTESVDINTEETNPTVERAEEVQEEKAEPLAPDYKKEEEFLTVDEIVSSPDTTSTESEDTETLTTDELETHGSYENAPVCVPDYYPLHLLNVPPDVLNYLQANKVSTYHQIQEFFLKTPEPVEPFVGKMPFDTYERVAKFKKMIFLQKDEDMKKLINSQVFNIKNAIEAICKNIKAHQKPFILASLENKEKEILGNSPMIINLVKKVRAKFFLEMTAVLRYHKSLKPSADKEELFHLIENALMQISDKDDRRLAELAVEKVKLTW